MNQERKKEREDDKGRKEGEIEAVFLRSGISPLPIAATAGGRRLAALAKIDGRGSEEAYLGWVRGWLPGSRSSGTRSRRRR